MSNLTTRKIVLGLLMTLVLAFSVQGIADALTLTETSSATQSERMGSNFEMSFTIGKGGNNVIAYHSTYPNRRVNAEDPAEAYIDAQGYPVTYIGETRTSYRNTDTNGPAGSDPPGGTFVYGSRPSYDDETNLGSTGDPSLVDISGNLYHFSGNASYIRRGDGRREVRGENNQIITAANLWTYVRATLSNTTGISTAGRVAETPALFDYNDEAISITTVRVRGATGILKLKSPSFVFPNEVTIPIDTVDANNPGPVAPTGEDGDYRSSRFYNFSV